MHKIYVLRSRYQPYTKHHFDAIISLVLHKREDFERGAILLLAVVRDYENLLRLYEPKTIQQVEDVDFRHLPLFNPLSFIDIVVDIKENIDVYLEIDNEHHSFLHKVLHRQLVIAPLAVKFSDLAVILKDQSAVPPGIQGVFPKVKKLSPDQQRFLRMLNHKAYDTLNLVPGIEAKRTWFLPLLDIEDCRDANYTEDMIGEELAVGVFNTMVPSFGVTGLTIGARLGLYGAFACFALGLLQKECNLSPVFQLDQIEGIIGKCASSSTINRYKTRLTNRVKEVKRLWENNNKAPEQFYSRRDVIERKLTSVMIVPDDEACAEIASKGERVLLNDRINLQNLALSGMADKLVARKNDYEAWKRLPQCTESGNSIEAVLGLIQVVCDKSGQPPPLNQNEVTLMTFLANCLSHEEFLKLNIEVTAISKITHQWTNNKRH